MQRTSCYYKPLRKHNQKSGRRYYDQVRLRFVLIHFLSGVKKIQKIEKQWSGNCYYLVFSTFEVLVFFRGTAKGVRKVFDNILLIILTNLKLLFFTVFDNQQFTVFS